jgi:hypothetical protein
MQYKSHSAGELPAELADRLLQEAVRYADA